MLFDTLVIEINWLKLFSIVLHFHSCNIGLWSYYTVLQCWLLLLKFHQMAPLYKITLSNLVLIGMVSIHWPWQVQKSCNYVWQLSRYSGKCRVAPFILTHPVYATCPRYNSVTDRRTDRRTDGRFTLAIPALHYVQRVGKRQMQKCLFWLSRRSL